MNENFSLRISQPLVLEDIIEIRQTWSGSHGLEWSNKIIDSIKQKNLLLNDEERSDDQPRDDHGRFSSTGDSAIPVDTTSFTMANNHNSQQNDAFNNYTQSAMNAAQINNSLRTDATDSPAWVQQDVSALDSLISSAPALTQDTTTFRGVGPGDFSNQLQQMQPGDSFTDKGFVSSSQSSTYADMFAQGGTKMEITIPEGTKALNVATFNPSYLTNNEQEMILARGTSFTMTGRSGDVLQFRVGSK